MEGADVSVAGINGRVGREIGGCSRVFINQIQAAVRLLDDSTAVLMGDRALCRSCSSSFFAFFCKAYLEWKCIWVVSNISASYRQSPRPTWVDILQRRDF